MTQVRAPILRPGDIVALDNAAVHKMKAAREAVEACGARWAFLPPYSPDLNPIELCWSKVKGLSHARQMSYSTRLSMRYSPSHNLIPCILCDTVGTLSMPCFNMAAAIFGFTYTGCVDGFDIWAKRKEKDDFLYSGSIQIKATDVPAIILSLAITLSITLGDVKTAGAQAARLFITEHTLQTKMVLNAPALVDVQPTVMYTGANSLYVYDGLYLLTYNDRRYFVFKDVSPECRPAQVFVVKEEQVLTMQYLSSAPLSVECTPVPLTPMPTLLPPMATPTP